LIDLERWADGKRAAPEWVDDHLVARSWGIMPQRVREEASALDVAREIALLNAEHHARKEVATNPVPKGGMRLIG
jgi:hypothetical protein